MRETSKNSDGGQVRAMVGSQTRTPTGRGATYNRNLLLRDNLLHDLVENYAKITPNLQKKDPKFKNSQANAQKEHLAVG